MNNLPVFIETVGDAEAARLFGVAERTAASWRRRERYPRAPQAQIIVQITKNHSCGPVDYSGIYGPDQRYSSRLKRQDQPASEAAA